MADFVIKANDTHVPVEAALTDESGIINLTTATSVKFLIKKTGLTVSGACVIVSAAAGTVKYVWAPGDTAAVGTYQMEFEITWNDGTIETVPNDGYKSLEIVADLG